MLLQCGVFSQYMSVTTTYCGSDSASRVHSGWSGARSMVILLIYVKGKKKPRRNLVWTCCASMSTADKYRHSDRVKAVCDGKVKGGSENVLMQKPTLRAVPSG